MNPHYLLFCFVFLAIMPTHQFLRSCIGKIKALQKRGYVLRHTDTCSLRLDVGVCFSFQSHGEKTIHQKGRAEADADSAAHRGEHGAGGALLQQEGKCPPQSGGQRDALRCREAW